MKKHTRTNHEKGLTFIELIVVISIFAIMGSIVLFRFDSFNKKIALDTLAQDIALRIVEAQKAAISGVSNANFSSGALVPAYGVYFRSAVSAGADNTKFVYFNDTITDRKYSTNPATACPLTPSLLSECLAETTITSGDYVSNICYITASGIKSCAGTGSLALHVSFKRPFPDASLLLDPNITADRAYVEVSSRDGAMQKTITINSLGHVSVVNGKACTILGLC